MDVSLLSRTGVYFRLCYLYDTLPTTQRTGLRTPPETCRQFTHFHHQLTNCSPVCLGDRPLFCAAIERCRNGQNAKDFFRPSFLCVCSLTNCARAIGLALPAPGIHHALISYLTAVTVHAKLCPSPFHRYRLSDAGRN